MSLAALIAAMDDDALVAAASKGLLTRAKKDVEAGQVNGDAPVLSVAGETVTLSDRSVEAATCTCPATGTCRHVLAAVLHLRAAAARGATETEAEAKADDTGPPAFALDEIETFAGADWPRAVALAEQGRAEGIGTITVRFEETGESVAFPRGQPLKQALYKGPRETRRRMAVAAAALVLARDRGEALPETAVRSGPRADPETLAEARAAIEAAAVALAAGTLDAARDRLFATAITARAEAVPRLAAEMRGASRRMDPEALRRAEETPVALLMALARAHALTLALEAAPEDPALTGTLARSFIPSGRREITMLGAEWWQTPAGAKGFTAIFADLDSGRFHRAVHARAAGTDLSFNPQSGWSLPLWSLAPPSKLGAERIVLADAALAPDGGLGLNQTADWADATVSLRDLESCGAGLRDFDRLDELAEAQLGIGLRARPGEAFAVLLPERVHAAEYDAYAQRTVWYWEDALGRQLPLIVAGDADWSDRLNARVRQVRGGLVAIRPGQGEARLISLWLGDPAPLSLRFQQLPKLERPGLMDRLRGTVGAVIGAAHVTPQGPIDLVRLATERALEGVLSGLTGRHGLPEHMRADAEALGLSLVATLDDAWRAGGVTEAMRLAYVLTLAQGQLSGR